MHKVILCERFYESFRSKQSLRNQSDNFNMHTCIFHYHQHTNTITEVKSPRERKKWYRDQPTLLKLNASNISSSCWAPISVCLPSVIITNLVLTLSDPKAVYGTTK